MSKFGFPTLLVVLLFALLSGCAQRGGPVPYATEPLAQPDNERPALARDEGIIGKLDTLSVQVYQLPDLSRDIQVDRDGNIAMPLVGTVHAEGQTAPQVAQEITARLAANYVRSPSVQVAIKQTVTRTLTVEGAVKRPGIYEVRGQTTLLGAIALGAGPDDNANIHRVVVFRQIDGHRNAAAFDLETIRNGLADDPAIYGNDTVVVDGSGLTRAYRELLQAVPLLYVFRAL